jgi:hypothetical protein
MANETNGGGPAFPSIEAVEDLGNLCQRVVGTTGMSLRDWFAGQALAGFLASYAVPEVPMPEPGATAEKAYEYADAMLAAGES